MTPDEFERALEHAVGTADAWLKQRAGKTYQEMSQEEKDLLNEFVTLGSMRVELANDAARCLMSAFRLCDRLMKLAMEHDVLREHVDGETFIMGLTFIDTHDDGVKACLAMQRAGKVMLVKAIDLYNQGKLADEVARMRAAKNVLPKLSDLPSDWHDAENDDA